MAGRARRAITTIKIVDDNAATRRSMSSHAEDAQLKVVEDSGPLGDLQTFIGSTTARVDALLCDHYLRQRRNYSTFSGAEAVAELYKIKFPALLCTAWEQVHGDEIRRRRRFIPILLRPSELNPDSIIHGLEECRREFRGKYRQGRVASRALVRVEEVDGDDVYVIVPAFAHDDVIRVPIKDLSKPVRAAINQGTRRFHAMVNLGAGSHDEVFFERWEA